MLRNDFKEWYSNETKLDNQEAMLLFEQSEGIKLPSKYKEMVRFRDGGTLEKHIFTYKFEGRIDENGVGYFLRWQPHDDSDSYTVDDKKVPRHFFLSGLVPITYEGDGNWLCFDYRSYNDDPSVISWHRVIGENEILDHIQNPSEFFPKGLIPFAPDGGGNYVCFDYRHCKENPPIVFWHHGFEEGKDVFYLADSFEEFISGLKSEGEIDHAT
jgi:hypothetical protein